MDRCPVVCVFKSGETFRASREEAAELVRNGLGSWDGENRIRMEETRSCGRLSLRVGARLAVAVGKNQDWACVMLQEISRR
jgi:hypothetical protein